MKVVERVKKIANRFMAMVKAIKTKIGHLLIEIINAWCGNKNTEDDISMNSFEIYDTEGNVEDAFVQILKDIDADKVPMQKPQEALPETGKRAPKVNVYMKNSKVIIELNLNIRMIEGIDAYDTEMNSKMLTYIQSDKVGVVSNIKVQGFNVNVYTDKVRDLVEPETLLRLHQINPYLYIDRAVHQDPIQYMGKFVGKKATALVKYQDRALCRTMTTTIIHVVRFHKRRKKRTTDEVSLVVLLLDYDENLVYVGGIVSTGDHQFIIVRTVPVKSVGKCYILASSILIYDVEYSIQYRYGKEC